MVKMIDYDGELVPEELCTVGRDGAADDFVGCGKCSESEEGFDCKGCIIDKLFKEYAGLTGQVQKKDGMRFVYTFDTDKEFDVIGESFFELLEAIIEEELDCKVVRSKLETPDEVMSKGEWEDEENE